MTISKLVQAFQLRPAGRLINSLILILIVVPVTLSSSATLQSDTRAPLILQAPDFDIRGPLANALPALQSTPTSCIPNPLSLQSPPLQTGLL